MRASREHVPVGEKPRGDEEGCPFCGEHFEHEHEISGPKRTGENK
jgi:hypothetical protein